MTTGGPNKKITVILSKDALVEPQKPSAASDDAQSLVEAHKRTRPLDIDFCLAKGPIFALAFLDHYKQKMPPQKDDSTPSASGPVPMTFALTK